MSDSNRQPRRTRRAKENPKRPQVPGRASDQRHPDPRRPERQDEPSGRLDREEEEKLPVYRPDWRDPDCLDRHPIPDEAWDVFELDDDAEAEPEQGDFRAESEDEPLE